MDWVVTFSSVEAETGSDAAVSSEVGWADWIVTFSSAGAAVTVSPVEAGTSVSAEAVLAVSSAADWTGTTDAGAGAGAEAGTSVFTGAGSGGITAEKTWETVDFTRLTMWTANLNHNPSSLLCGCPPKTHTTVKKTNTANTIFTLFFFILFFFL